jgi:hypothetical protein
MFVARFEALTAEVAHEFLLGCDAVSVGKSFPMFRTVIVFHLQGQRVLQKIKVLRSCKTSGSARPTTKRHAPEDFNLRLKGCFHEQDAATTITTAIATTTTATDSSSNNNNLI